MKDPYEVLGVDKNASMEEVKSAYKELVKKYHPDKYQNNPLADLAKEKLQEVNEAYDAISKGRTGGYSGSSYSSSNSGSYGASGSSEMQSVRNMINSGNLMGAKSVLDRSDVRNAEWFFLNGIISSRYGRFDEAVSYVSTAVNMEPTNMEYRQTLNALANSGSMYRNNSNRQGYDNDSLLKCCAAYACFDCACPCI